MARVIGIVGGDEEGGGTEITDLDHLVGMVSGTGSSEHRGQEKAFSLRLPIHLAARVKAMAEHGKVSQNELLVNLMDFAVSEVYDNLDKKVQKSLEKLTSKVLADLSSEGAAS